MKLLLITGSRTWKDPAPIASAISDHLGDLPVGGTLTVVVGYDPKRRQPPGVDEIAYDYCVSIAEDAWCVGRAVVVETYPADWQAPCRPECDHGPRGRNRRGEEYCKAAGDYRNADMVNRVAAAGMAGHDAACLAFIDPCVKPNCPFRHSLGTHGSHGASHCADLAEAADIDTRRYP